MCSVHHALSSHRRMRLEQSEPGSSWISLSQIDSKCTSGCLQATVRTVSQEKKASKSQLTSMLVIDLSTISSASIPTQPVAEPTRKETSWPK